MKRQLEEIIKAYTPDQQTQLRWYAERMVSSAERHDYNHYLLYGSIFYNLTQVYWARNAIDKVTGLKK